MAAVAFGATCVCAGIEIVDDGIQSHRWQFIF
jgi:hypothetical protein